jgi:hypothetical protein
MTRMVDDETIYRDFACEQLSDKDIKNVHKLLVTWTGAAELLPESERTVKIIFNACVNIIGTMGPAYCRVAAATLLHHADEQDEQDEEDEHE